MAGDWVERAIGDLGEIVGGSTPSTADPSNFDGDVPWLTPKDLSGPHDRYVRRGERNITKKGLVSCSTRLLPKNTVLLSSRAPIGYVAIAANPIATNQGFKSLVLKKDYDHEFIYYWLTANVEELERHASGSTFKELSGTALKQIRLRLPSLQRQQRAIAHVLGSLDDKIELNRRIAGTLEGIARALFRSWFVDFDPVYAKVEGRDPCLPNPLADLFPARFANSGSGTIPESWRTVNLSEFSQLNPEAWSKDNRPSTIDYVDLTNTKWGRIEAITPHDRETAPSRAQRVLRVGDTIVGTVRPGNGSYALVARGGLTGSTGFAVLRPSRPEYSEFIYLAATAPENIDALSHLADGGAYPAVRPEVVAAVLTVRASDELIGTFSRIVRPLLASIARAEGEDQTLTALRHTLLPKLISGELQVREVEGIVKGATA